MIILPRPQISEFRKSGGCLPIRLPTVSHKFLRNVFTYVCVCVVQLMTNTPQSERPTVNAHFPSAKLQCLLW